MATRPRIVIATPLAPECTAVAEWIFAEGFEPIRATTVSRALQEVKDNPFDLLVADYDFALRGGLLAASRERVRNVKAPTVVLGAADAAAEAAATRRDAMYVTRPIDRTAFTCSVHMALIDSRPERRSLRKRVARFDAVVGGVPSHIVDISNEGLRLEIPRSRHAAPPSPVFQVRVPLVGVTLSVRRMWTCHLPAGGSDAAWYGGELAGNAPRIEVAWRSFVDAIPTSGIALEYR